MNHLREQHKAVIIAVVVITASIYLFLQVKGAAFHTILGTLGWSRIAQAIATLLQNLGWFGLTWTLIASGFILLYENVLWKVINPKLDFSGTWSFTEKQVELESTTHTYKHKYNAKGSMRIDQGVRGIRIVEGQTRKESVAGGPEEIEIASWWSLACELSECGSLIYSALDHRSAPTLEGGAVKHAVEIYSVAERGILGRPTKLSSTVYHCVGEGTPHIVTVHYTRA